MNTRKTPILQESEPSGIAGENPDISGVIPGCLIPVAGDKNQWSLISCCMQQTDTYNRGVAGTFYGRFLK